MSKVKVTDVTAGDFMEKVVLQAEINRVMHGDRERSQLEWAAIAATHMGHLMEAVLSGDKDLMEKELLHTVAPLLELYGVSKNTSAIG